MNENVAYVVYDFSYLEDKVDMVMENVHFSVKPGIKCVPNAVAMKVFSAVYNEWQEIISDKNNTVWTRSVTQPHLGNTGEYFEFYYDFTITVGLFDNDGNLLVQNKNRQRISFLSGCRDVACLHCKRTVMHGATYSCLRPASVGL